ncbi:UNVERIFIED_CONTAM: hypothetical protein NCL1_02688 [Trichonephila clavipes]
MTSKHNTIAYRHFRFLRKKEGGRYTPDFKNLYCLPNPGEDMDVYKCIVPSRHGRSLNSRQAAIPLVSLVEGEERLRTEI